MLQGPEISTELKGIIIGMANSSKSAWQIALELDKLYSTITYVIRCFKKTQSTKNLPRSGRPSLLTKCDKNHLVRAVKANRFKPLHDITNQLPINCSIDTACNALKEYGVGSFIAAKKPKITPKNIKRHKD